MTEEIKNLIDNDLNTIVTEYNTVIGNLFNQTNPGQIRKQKGDLVEDIAERLVRLTWEKVLQQDFERMIINQEKQDIHIQNLAAYAARTDFTERDSQIIQAEGADYVYEFSTDRHVLVDENLVIAIECKSYTEVSMLKRIAFDSMLMDEAMPNATHCIVQLEKAFSDEQYHVIMSHHAHNIKVITLLDGKRNAQKPIHKREHFKPLNKENLIKAIEYFEEVLTEKI